MRDLFSDILLRQHKAGGLFVPILPYSNPLNRNRNMINEKRIHQLINYIKSIKPSSWYYNQFPDVVECLYCLLNEDFRKYTYQYCYHKYRFADIVITKLTEEIWV